MSDLFLLLFFVSFGCLITGLVKPSIFNRFVKKELKRKHIGLIFGAAMFVFFLLTGITNVPTPAPISESTTAPSLPPTTLTTALTEVIKETVTETPTTKSQKLSIGEEGIINFREDKNDCSGEDIIILGITKEAQGKISKALLAKDYIGLEDLLLSGEAFEVNICTKAKVIDTAFGLRQVRILEGDNFGKSGWLPYEWIK